MLGEFFVIPIASHLSQVTSQPLGSLIASENLSNQNLKAAAVINVAIIVSLEEKLSPNIGSSHKPSGLIIMELHLLLLPHFKVFYPVTTDGILGNSI